MSLSCSSCRASGASSASCTTACIIGGASRASAGPPGLVIMCSADRATNRCPFRAVLFSQSATPFCSLGMLWTIIRTGIALMSSLALSTSRYKCGYLVLYRLVIKLTANSESPYTITALISPKFPIFAWINFKHRTAAYSSASLLVPYPITSPIPSTYLPSESYST